MTERILQMDVMDGGHCSTICYPVQIENKPIYQFVKRVFDIILALILGIVLMIPLLAVAVVIRRESPGPVIFKQTRIGKNGAEEAVGAVKTADGYAAVTVHHETFTPDDTWSDREINIVFTMQEALNKVLENLPLESTDVLKTDSEVAQQPENKPAQKPDTETLPPEMLEDMALDTPYMELHYPSEWADYLSIKVNKGNPYSVGYYCSIGSHADQHLFTVYFGGQKGTPLKTIKTESGEQVEIRIDVPELSLNDSWTEEEKTFAFAMQEDLNYLLGKMS